MSFSNARCNLNVCLLGCKVIMRAEFYLEAYLSWLNHLIWALMRVTLSVDGTLPINSWNSISSHGSNPWMHDASCSASWNASRSGVRWKARQNALEFLPEIVVEPGIEEYVVAGGWHGYRVSQKAENPFNKKKENGLESIERYDEKGDQLTSKDCSISTRPFRIRRRGRWASWWDWGASRRLQKLSPWQSTCDWCDVYVHDPVPLRGNSSNGF